MTSTHPQSAPTRPRIDSGAAALWASAFVILAMVIMQASRLGPGNAALAGQVSNVGDLTVLTAAAGDDDDILAVLDRREEVLYIYGIDSRKNLEFFQVERLNNVFGQASTRGGSR